MPEMMGGPLVSYVVPSNVKFSKFQWPEGGKTELEIGKYLDDNLGTGNWLLTPFGSAGPFDLQTIQLTYRCPHGRLVVNSTILSTIVLVQAIDASQVILTTLHELVRGVFCLCNNEHKHLPNPVTTMVNHDGTFDGDGILFLSSLRKMFPGLDTPVSLACPGGGDIATCQQHRAKVPCVWDTVTHLNDVHRWTREQIADWLDSLDIDLTLKHLPEEEKVATETVDPYYFGYIVQQSLIQPLLTSEQIRDMLGLPPGGN